jgi:hypothetical protein
MAVGLVWLNVRAKPKCDCDGLYDEPPPCDEMCDDSNDSDSDGE